MNDDRALTTLSHRLTEVRDALGDEHMTMPASEIFARRSRRRTRRWLTTAGATCAVAGVTVGLTLTPASSPRPQHAQHAQLAAWTVRANPGGTVTFTLRNTSHPAQLQRALAKAGVPAVVRWGEVCQSRGSGPGLMNTKGFVKPDSVTARSIGVASFFGALGGPGQATRNPDLGWAWTITPSKITPGGHFVISMVPGKIPASDFRAIWEFVHTDASLTCARFLKP